MVKEFTSTAVVTKVNLPTQSLQQLVHGPPAMYSAAAAEPSGSSVATAPMAVGRLTVPGGLWIEAWMRMGRDPEARATG